MTRDPSLSLSAGEALAGYEPRRNARFASDPTIRRSMIREAYTSTPSTPSSNPTAVDKHMQEWMDEGWTLVSLTTVQRGEAMFDLVHTFVWTREASIIR